MTITVTALLLATAIASNTDPPERPMNSGWARPFARLGLLADGYIPLDLKQGRRSGWPFVTATIGGVTTTLLVDTGASVNVLDPHWVREHIPEAVGYKKPADGQRPVVEVIVYGRHFYTRLGLDPVTTPAQPFYYMTKDQGMMVSGDGIPASEGILGTPFLRYYSAVVDCGSNTLYLLDPARREAGLQGEWVGTEMHDGGRKGALKDKANTLRLTVRGSEAVLTVSGEERQYNLVLNLSKTPRQVDLMTADGRGLQGLYKLDGDTLVLAAELFDNGQRTKNRPAAFTTAKGDPYSVVTFRRVKPKP